MVYGGNSGTEGKNSLKTTHENSALREAAAASTVCYAWKVDNAPKHSLNVTLGSVLPSTLCLKI